MIKKYLVNHIYALGIASTCLLIVSAFQVSQLANLNSDDSKYNDIVIHKNEEIRQKASLKLLKNFPAFGFDNLIADWTFLSFLQYFGDRAARRKTNYSLSSDFFEVIINRDPRFIDPYLFLSTSVSLYSGQPERGVQLQKTGLQSLDPHTDPRAYLVWSYKATDELLFLGDNKAARNSYQKVVEWAKFSSNPDSKRLSALSARTARFLANRPNSKSARINAWLLVLVNAVDEDARQRAIQKIEQLGGQISFKENGAIRVLPPQED